MKVELSLEQLRLHMTALAGWERILKNLDAAREAGIVPPCYTAKEGTLRETLAEHRRFQQLEKDATASPSIRATSPCNTDELPMRMHTALETAVDAIVMRAPMLLLGPPGIGKTMLARRLVQVLPEPTEEQQRELTELYRYAGIIEPDTVLDGRPFRAPHHSVSAAGMVGNPERRGRRVAGEVDLAKHGVLFLDELPEFSRNTLAAINWNIVDDVQVVASSVPCPCGWAGSARRNCTCSDAAVQRFNERINRYCDLIGIAVRINIPSIVGEDLVTDARCNPTDVYRLRVTRAWKAN